MWKKRKSKKPKFGHSPHMNFRKMSFFFQKNVPIKAPYFEQNFKFGKRKVPCIFVHLRSGRPRPFFGCVWIFGKTGQIAFSRVFLRFFFDFSHFAQNRRLWSGHFFEKKWKFAKSYMRGMAEFRFFWFSFFHKTKKKIIFFSKPFFPGMFFFQKHFFGFSFFSHLKKRVFWENVALPKKRVFPKSRFLLVNHGKTHVIHWKPPFERGKRFSYEKFKIFRT